MYFPKEKYTQCTMGSGANSRRSWGIFENFCVKSNLTVCRVTFNCKLHKNWGARCATCANNSVGGATVPPAPSVPVPMVALFQRRQSPSFWSHRKNVRRSTVGNSVVWTILRLLWKRDRRLSAQLPATYNLDAKNTTLTKRPKIAVSTTTSRCSTKRGKDATDTRQDIPTSNFFTVRITGTGLILWEVHG